MEITRYRFIIVVFALAFGKGMAQDHSVQDEWKWRGATEPPLIVVGEDTLTEPPYFSLVEGAWWEAFGYPELTALTDLAVSGNRELKIGESSVKESRARVKYAKSFLYPSLSFNPSVARQEFSANRPLPFDVPPQSVINNTYAVPLDLSYEVDITGKIRNGARASEYNWQSVNASQDGFELAVAAAVSRNFFRLLTLDAEAEILQRTLNTRRESLEIVEARYSAGLTNEIDYQRAKTEFSSVEVQLKNNRLQRTDIELELALLTGQPAKEFSLEAVELRFLAPAVDGFLPNDGNSYHPAIKAAEYGVESSKNEVKGARKDMYPSLYVNGSLGLLSGQTENIFENESRNWLVGATLAVPIFEGSRRKAQLEIKEHQLQATEDRLQQQKLQMNRAVERALSNIARTNEQLTIQREFVIAAQKAAELSRQRYRQGLVTYLEVVDAERVVLEAEKLLTQLLGQQLIGTVDLIEAVGGIPRIK